MTVSPIAVLSQPITFPNSGLTATNRFLKSAMTERLCTFNDEDPTDLESRGQVTKEYEELYRVWGEGQIGVIVLGNLPIQREGLEAKKNMIIDKDNVGYMGAFVRMPN
jgi:2,4-dienoyl-CoA reductase-like NADH-dependent reductase (Old Yellow Enzyme family)